jgi:hypothetical protein
VKKGMEEERKEKRSISTPCGSHQHLQPNHVDLKRLALILWILVDFGFWWNLWILDFGGSLEISC